MDHVYKRPVTPVILFPDLKSSTMSSLSLEAEFQPQFFIDSNPAWPKVNFEMTNQNIPPPKSAQMLDHEIPQGIRSNIVAQKDQGTTQPAAAVAHPVKYGEIRKFNRNRLRKLAQSASTRYLRRFTARTSLITVLEATKSTILDYLTASEVSSTTLEVGPCKNNLQRIALQIDQLLPVKFPRAHRGSERDIDSLLSAAKGYISVLKKRTTPIAKEKKKNSNGKGEGKTNQKAQKAKSDKKLELKATEVASTTEEESLATVPKKRKRTTEAIGNEIPAKVAPTLKTRISISEDDPERTKKKIKSQKTKIRSSDAQSLTIEDGTSTLHDKSNNITAPGCTPPGQETSATTTFELDSSYMDETLQMKEDETSRLTDENRHLRAIIEVLGVNRVDVSKALARMSHGQSAVEIFGSMKKENLKDKIQFTAQARA